MLYFSLSNQFPLPQAESNGQQQNAGKVKIGNNFLVQCITQKKERKFLTSDFNKILFRCCFLAAICAQH